MSTEIAKIGEQTYETLELAIQAVPTTGTLTEIELVNDYAVSAPITIPEGTKLILDLAGHTITAASGFNGRVFLNYGDFTIEDSVGTGLIDVSSSATGKGAASNYHLMKITGGTYRGNNTSAGATISNATAAQEFVLDGGTIESSSVAIVNSSKVTINSGAVHGTADNYVAIQNGGPTRPNAELTVNGGTIIGDHDNAIYNASKCTINNGTIQGHGYVTINNQSTGTMNILGGTISHDSSSCVLNDGIMNIEGGTFENDGCASDVYCVNSGNGNDAAAITVKDGAKISGTFGGLRIVGGSGTLEGGTFEATGCEEHDQVAYYALYAAGYIDNVNVTVKDGTFTSANNAAAHIGNAGGKPASIDVQGGKFVGAEGKDALVVESDVATSTITGGSFSKVPEGGLEVPEGFEEVEQEDGTVTVAPIKYTVTLNFGHDSLTEQHEVEYGHAFSKPEDPTRSGYIFKFWSADGSSEYNFETILTSDLELTALWDIAVAELSGVNYKSLAEAVDALVSGSPSTINLLSDAEVKGEAVEIPSGYEVTLNLNDHAIRMSGFTGRPITNNGTLTVNSTTEAGSIVTGGGECSGAINNYGTLTINNGTFGGGTRNGAAINNQPAGELIFNAGRVEGCPRGIQNLGTATIYHGTFLGQNTYPQENQGNAIINAGTLTIEDGTFVGALNAVSNMDDGNGTITVKGGTFNSTGDDGSGAFYNGTGCTLNIEDCVATTANLSGSTVANEGTLHITGGTFNGDNCEQETYTINSGQKNANPEVTIEGDVTVTGTFGAVRAVSGTINIDGGTYEVNECATHSDDHQYYAVYVAGQNGQVTGQIDGGTFKSSGNAAVTVGNQGGLAAQLTINDGVFESPEGISAVKTFGPGDAELYGGAYTSDVNIDVPEGYEAILQDGKYVVKKVWNVTFNLGYEGAPEATVVTVPNNTTIQQIPEAPIRVGYTFKHWEYEGSEFSFETPITQDIELTAAWEIIKLTVTLNFNDGSTPNEEHEVDYGTVFEKPADPTRTGFNFVQWNYEGQEYAFTDPITQDIELTAIWDAIDLSVTFDFGYEGKDPYVQGIEYGQVLQKIEDPEREGYTFTGWTKDGEPYTFENPVTESFTLVANWEIIVLHVTFDFNVEGIENDVVEVNYGSKVVVPETPENEGYKSLGWFDSEDQPFDFETPIVSDMTLHMNWEELPTIEDMLPILDSIDDNVVEIKDSFKDFSVESITNDQTEIDLLTKIDTSTTSSDVKLDTVITSLTPVATISSDIQAIKTAADATNTKLDTINTSTEGVKTSVDTLATNIAELDSTVAEVSGKLDTANTTAETSITKLTNIESKIQEVNTSIGASVESTDAVKDSVDALATTATDIKTSVSAIESALQVEDEPVNLTELTNKVISIDTKLDTTNTNTESTATKLDTVVEKLDPVTTIQTDVASIKTLVSGISGDADVDTVLTQINTNVEGVGTTLGTINTKIDELSGKAEDSLANQETSINTLETISASIEGLESVISNSNEVLNTINTTVTNVGESVETATASVDNMNNTTSDLKDAVDALKATNDAMQALLQSLSEVVKQNNVVLNTNLELSRKMLTELEKIRKGDTSDTPDVPVTEDTDALTLLSFQSLVNNARITGEVRAIWQHDMSDYLKSYCDANGYQYSSFPFTNPPANLGDLWLIVLPTE